MKYRFIFFGMAFGFLMSRAGATTFDNYAQLFLFENLQLLWVILTAVLVGISGMVIMKWFAASAIVSGARLTFEGKPMKKGLVLGALLFGVGWGLTGSCPGSAAAMLGEGKLMALPTGFGILLGTYIYGLITHGAMTTIKHKGTDPEDSHKPSLNFSTLKPQGKS